MLKSAVRSIVPKFLWKVLRSARLKYVEKSFNEYWVKHNYHGYDLDVLIADPLGQGWYDRNWKNLGELELLSKHRLKTGAKVIDFGGHQGVLAMILAKIVGPTGKVLAIEANSHNVQVARSNHQKNSLKNIEVEYAAVSDREGTIRFGGGFNGAIDHNSSTTLSEEVNTYPMDYFFQNKFVPDVVFVDIEGFEVLALRASKLQSELKCDWFVEVHGVEYISRFGGSPQELLSFFPKEKYSLYMAPQDGEFVALDEKSPIINERFYLVAIHKE